ncbi:MAG: electron transfer flavoprotein subunit alpha/FixB family protein [Anaerolineae bacterium]
MAENELDEYRGIWVYLEQYDGWFENVSLEILGKARELADTCGSDLTAVILGQDLEAMAGGAIQRGADHVLLADDPVLNIYTTDAYTAVMADLIQSRQPNVLLLGATHNGRDLAGRLAVRVRTGLTADAVRLDIDPAGELVAYTPGLGGRVLAACTCPNSRPQMATVRPGIFVMSNRDEGRTGSVERVPVAVDASDIRTEVLERVTGETVDLTGAERVVVAGLGTGGDLSLVRELATLLDADVGVTRPIADEGLIARDYQIGTTGASIRPEILIVVGASGAMHFTSGIEESETIIAVNIDPEAPMFEYADYCVVDDLFEVLPALIKRVNLNCQL